MESPRFSSWEISYFDVQREYNFIDEPEIRKSEFLFIDEPEIRKSEFLFIDEPENNFVDDDDAENLLAQKIMDAMYGIPDQWGESPDWFHEWKNSSFDKIMTWEEFIDREKSVEIEEFDD